MRGTDNGFTLIEVLIALVLFSLIGIAGFSLLNAIIGVQSRTEGRLDRLAELQRAMHVMVLDFQQVADTPIAVEGSSAVLRRYSDTSANPTIVVRYDLDESNFRRTLSRAGGESDQEQTLLSDVEALRWMFFAPSVGWTETWPPAGTNQERRPDAIAAELTIRNTRNGLAGVLRRVIRLPAQASP